MDVNKMKGYLHQYLHMMTQFCGRKKDKLKCAVSLMLTVSLVLSLCASNAFVLAAEPEEPGEKHIHNFTCRELICEEEHDDGEHTEECFAASGPWLCGLEEGQRHIHNQDGYNCWVMAKKLVCEATKSNADRDNGEDEGEALASGSDATGSNAKRLKTGRKHIHDAGCYEEVYECRPGGMEEQIALMSLGLEEESVKVSTWEEFKTAVESANAENVKTITLNDSFEATDSISINDGRRITLNLGDYTITCSNVSAGNDFCIGVGENSQLIIQGNGSIISEINGLDKLINVVKGTLNIIGGTLECHDGVRAILVNNGTVEMTGGCITNSGQSDSRGAAILAMNGSQLSINSGIITGNKGLNGGALNILDSTATITGNTQITDNDVTGNGGGIIVRNSDNDATKKSEVIISGKAEITGNSAENGGAIYVHGNRSSVKIKDEVKILGNETNNIDSQAIDAPDGAITIEGSNCQIQGMGRDLESLISGVPDKGTLELEQDYEVFSGIDINKEIKIDLKGHTITYVGFNKNQLFLVDGTLAGENSKAKLIIADTVGNGTVSSEVSGLNDLIRVQANGELVITGGTLENVNGLHGIEVDGTNGSNTKLTMEGGCVTNSGNGGASGGGVLVLYGASFRMSGGTISKNRAINGGGIDVLNASAIIEGNARIINNEASTDGGGINVRNVVKDFNHQISSVTINPDVGTTGQRVYISGNVAGNNGGGICIKDSSTLNIFGGTDISGNIAKNGGALYSSSSTKSSISGDVRIIENTSITENADVVVPRSAFNIQPEVEIQGSSKKGELKTLIDEKMLNNDQSLLLDRSYVESSAITINKDFSIDLRGQTITYDNGNQDGKLFDIVDGATLIIDDTVGGGTIISRNSDSDALICANGGKLQIKNGILENKEGNHAITANDGTVEISNGYIINSGIKDPSKVSNGGAVYLTNSTLQMTGGAIKENKSYSGGGIYAEKNSIVQISGGEISGNSAIDSGGSIRASGGSLIIGGQAQIFKNEASIGGGISFYDNANVVIGGNAKIFENYAEGGSSRESTEIGGITYDQEFGGGGIFVGLNSTLTLKDNCVIDNNRSNASAKNGRGGGGNGGGGIFSRGSVVMENGTVSNNYAKDSGGGIYSAGTFIMRNGTISGNTAHLDEGGGLRVDGKGSEITGGSIMNNKTETEFDWGGGGIFVNSGGKLTIENLLVTGNTAAGFGGGVGGCSSGDIEIFALKGAAIYSNTAEGSNLANRPGHNKRDDQAISEIPVFKANKCNDYFCAGTSTVYGTMLGGMDAGWKGSFGNAERNTDGTKKKEDGCTVYRKDQIGEVIIPADGSKHADGWLALGATNIPADMSALGTVAVTISDNYSNTHGGGIMSNGELVLGESSNTCSLTIRKQVNGAQADRDKEYPFEVKLANTKKTVDNYIYRKTNAQGTVVTLDPGTVIKDKVNGIVGFSLKDNESMEILGLLAGTEYTVTETGADEYGTYTAVNGGKAEVIEENKAKTVSGAVYGGNGAEVVFTNSKSSIIAEKENLEEGGEEKEFKFTITLENENGLGSEYVYKKWTGGQPDTQEKTCRISGGRIYVDNESFVTLKHNERIEIIGLPQGTSYTIEETEAAAYTTDISVSGKRGYEPDAEASLKIQKGQRITGTIDYKDSVIKIKFTNSRKPENPDNPGPDPTPDPESGTLTISKLVTGTDEQREFTFTVRLTDKDGNPLEGTFPYNGSKSGEIFNGGMVKLSHGESITILDLPAGARYHVAEREANMDGYATIETVVKGDGEIIQSEQDSHIRFENRKEQEAPKGSLTIKKTVTGDPAPSNQEFAFAVTLTAPDGNILYGEYPYTGSERNGTFVSGNPAPGIVTLKAGEWITITGLPVGTRYLVMETDESREGYVATPLEKEEVITETNLDPAVEVVNHKIPQSEPGFGTLTVSKAVTGTEERKEFTFTVRLMDGDGNPLPGEFRYDGSKSGMVSDGGQIKLAHGESVTIYDLPENTRYHVIEQEANTDSYVTTVKGDNGIIQSEENAYMDFVNHKEEEPDTPGPKDPTSPEPEDPTSPRPEDPTSPKPEDPTPSESEETPATEPDHPTHPDQERPTNPGNPGGGGGGRDRDNPTQPAPETPTQPEGVPAEPTGEQPPQPAEPSPENQAVPPGETPVVTELPDPNDPNSPDTVILMEDGVPRAYKKVWDPEAEEYVYMLDEDIPLAGMEMPKTGDPTRTNMWLILWILSLIGAGISWTARGRRRDRDDRLL